MATGGSATWEVAGYPPGLEGASLAGTDQFIEPGRAQPAHVPFREPLLQETVILSVTKSASNEGGDPLFPSERITYSIVISNSGIFSATGVVVSDTFPANTNFVAGSITVSPSSAGGTPGTSDTQPIIASGITVTPQIPVTVTYAVTVSGPLANGTVIANTVSVTSTEVPTPTSSTVSSTVTASPTLEIIKDGPFNANVGETIVYTFTLTHAPTSDDSTITQVVLIDTIVGTLTNHTGDDPPRNKLEVGETWVYTAPYTIQPEDPDPLQNSATVTGRDENQNPVSATSSIHTLNVAYAPALSITKTGPASASLGDTVVYTITVGHDTLIGDGSPITQVVVTDDIASPVSLVEGDDGDMLLEVEETWTYTAPYTIQPDSPDPLENVATVEGRDAEGGDVSPVSDTHSLNLAYAPALSITKTGPATASVGDTVVYSITVSHNTLIGDSSSITQVLVTDSIASPVSFVEGDNGQDGLLEVGETWTYTASYTIPPTVTNILINTAQVTGQDEGGQTVTDSDSHDLNVGFSPALSITKTGPTAASVGDTVTYVFTVTHALSSDGSPVSNVTMT
ncbi:MAG: hypothetical protein JSV81_02450, partial [Anaerolineales bacterium]